MIDVFVGDRIGKGASREVYSVVYDDSLVLKVETTGRTFHNQTEWLVWQEMKKWPISDWFAPCVGIDSYGNCLLQKRTKPFDFEKEFLQAVQRTRGGRIPGVFDDVHFANFGMLDELVVCHDYGYHKFFEKAARDLSIAGGHIQYDDEEAAGLQDHDMTKGGQFELDL